MFQLVSVLLTSLSIRSKMEIQGGRKKSFLRDQNKVSLLSPNALNLIGGASMFI